MSDPIVVLASAQRTATANSATFTNYEHKGVRLYLVISAYAAGTLDVKVQSKDPVSGNYIDMLSAAFAQQAATTTGLDLIIYPGIAETANRSVSDVLPQTWRVVATLATDPDITFSVGGHYLD